MRGLARSFCPARPGSQFRGSPTGTPREAGSPSSVRQKARISDSFLLCRKTLRNSSDSFLAARKTRNFRNDDRPGEDGKYQEHQQDEPGHRASVRQKLPNFALIEILGETLEEKREVLKPIILLRRCRRLESQSIQRNILTPASQRKRGPPAGSESSCVTRSLTRKESRRMIPSRWDEFPGHPLHPEKHASPEV